MCTPQFDLLEFLPEIIEGVISNSSAKKAVGFNHVIYDQTSMAFIKDNKMLLAESLTPMINTIIRTFWLYNFTIFNREPKQSFSIKKVKN